MSFSINRRSKAEPAPLIASASPPSVQFRPALARRSGGIYRRGLKRALDLCLIAVAAPIVVPVIGVLALLVAAQGGQPFYVQDRVGLEGRAFRMWKLRSMVPGADSRLQDYLDAHPAAREEWDLAQKLQSDPRITWLGKVLRRSSLDELPQLWNVVLGDMYLVGPRPMMPSQQDINPGLAYYRLLPSITGTWQVSARNESTFAERARYDREYDRDLSFWTDLSILIRTLRVVALATGK